MLNKARSLYDTLKSSWNAGSNEDDIQLALYAAAEEEFDSGNTKKGLLAKISVEANYDDKVIKAKYIKARVDVLMSRRDAILSLMRSIEMTNQNIINIDVELKSISKSHQVDNDPIAEDYEKAENDFYLQINRTTESLRAKVENYDFILFTLVSVVLGLLIWLAWNVKSLSILWITASVGLVTFLSFWGFRIIKRNKILSDRVKQLAEDKKNELEQANFLENKTYEYCKERVSRKQASILMQRQDREKQRSVLHQKMKSLQDELKNIFS